jgi:hypothetical protein
MSKDDIVVAQNKLDYKMTLSLQSTDFRYNPGQHVQQHSAGRRLHTKSDHDCYAGL